MSELSKAQLNIILNTLERENKQLRLKLEAAEAENVSLRQQLTATDISWQNSESALREAREQEKQLQYTFATLKYVLSVSAPSLGKTPSENVTDIINSLAAYPTGFPLAEKAAEKIMRMCKEIGAAPVPAMPIQDDKQATCVVEWQSPESVPDVKQGSAKTFWICCENENGKRYTYSAVYLNFPIESHDDHEYFDDNGDPFDAIGWYENRTHESYDTYVEQIIFSEHYRLIGWADYKTPEFALPQSEVKPSC